MNENEKIEIKAITLGTGEIYRLPKSIYIDNTENLGKDLQPVIQALLEQLLELKPEVPEAQPEQKDDTPDEN